MRNTQTERRNRFPPACLRRMGIAGLLALAGLVLSSVAQAQTVLDVACGDADYPPFEMKVQGRVAGLHGEMIEAAAARLGWSVRWRSLPWKRVLLELEQGRVAAASYVSPTPERERFALFLEGNRLSTSELRLVVLRGAVPDFDGDLSRFLATRKLIALRGFKFGLPLVDAAPKIEALNMADALRLLREGFSDVAALNWNDFVGAYGDKPEFQQVVPLKPALHSISAYLAFSRARPDAQERAQRFAAALGEYRKTPEYAALLRRHRLDAIEP
ncbi:substrate-binding periplasmic protein [Roseateles aquae]|nr:transporter substrate-binding domain-containing protein [Paucibacter sp. APW11]